jgi:hypothetical protein
MVGSTVGVSGRGVAGGWVSGIVEVKDGSVAGTLVLEFKVGWQAARNKQTNSKILFKCELYPSIDMEKFIRNECAVLPPGPMMVRDDPYYKDSVRRRELYPLARNHFI